MFFPLDPKAEDICIEDIAHALAMKCRFTGHCRKFYSIAEHSVRLSCELPTRIALEGLLHDAAEAYLPDMASPIKGDCWFTGPYGNTKFQTLEGAIMALVADKFGLHWPLPDLVREADLRMLSTEKRDLMAPEPAPWATLPDPYPDTIEPWLPDEAEARFLEQFRFLTEPMRFATCDGKAATTLQPQGAT